jgi:hypothetical protein
VDEIMLETSEERIKLLKVGFTELGSKGQPC